MKLIKKAIEIGNGAAVYVPKEYSGREIVIILPEGIVEIRRRIIERLEDYMENIVGVYLFGSYARGESHSLSDIDLLIITQNEAKELKHLFTDMDVRVSTLDGIKKSIEHLPAISLPIIREAKTIINPILLEELKKSKINYKNFRWNFDDTRRVIKIIEDFIKIDEEDIGLSHIYSLFMRARVCYMIDGLLRDKQFSNKGLQEELAKRGLDRRKYEEYYNIYRKVRDDEEVEGKIDKSDITQFINIIKKYASELENESKKKIKKRN
ncbi:MAG: nucleotidyltransferase domain-containing protein [archaeon]|nr:nucleotidyltransferase domain-containing protein [archaeon]